MNSLTLGLIFVVFLTYSGGFSNFSIGGMEDRHPAMRVVVMIVIIPIVGVVLTIVGFLGLLALTPYLSLLGFEWVFTFN